MHKLLNLFCLPLLIAGLTVFSHGILGYNSFELESITSSKTSSQINNLYSEKEIILKDPPVSEILSEKIIVKVRKKPINPKIVSYITNKNNVFNISYLSDNDFNHLSNEKKDFVKTVLPIIINENQNILTTRYFVNGRTLRDP